MNRELLEFAAKAAGIEVWFPRMSGGRDSDGKRIVLTPCHTSAKDGTTIEWNPLVDDGDALRLAVILKMVVDTDYNGGCAAGNADIDMGDPEFGYQEGCGEKDYFAATRRAIVRVAAEIGRQQ